MMTKRDMLLYKNMSPEDQRKYDRWLKASAVVGSIFAAAIVAMALAESNVLGTSQASAKSTHAAKVGATKERHERSGAITGYQIVF